MGRRDGRKIMSRFLLIAGAAFAAIALALTEHICRGRIREARQSPRPDPPSQSALRIRNGQRRV
jgi:hypothetical protein